MKAFVRKLKLNWIARKAGCKIAEFKDGTKSVSVFVPGFPTHGIGIEMTKQIEHYFSSGSPTAWEIIYAAIEQAEDENYGPVWNYICEYYTRNEIDRRERSAFRRKLLNRGRHVRV
jgi:hypothetical protein